MNCREIEERLSDFIEGTLAEEEHAAVRNHLDGCSRCRAEWEGLVQTIRDVAALRETEPPPGFSTRVMARIREEADRPRLWRRLFLPLSIKIPLHALGLFLIVAVGVYLYESNPILQEELGRSREGETALPTLSKPAETLPSEDTTVREGGRKEEVVPPAGFAGRERIEKRSAPSREAAANQMTPPPASLAETDRFSNKPREDPAAEVAPSREEVRSHADLNLTVVLHEPIDPSRHLEDELLPLVKQAGGSLLIEKKSADTDRPSGETVYWVALPADRIDRLKAALASLGTVQAETPSAVTTPGPAPAPGILAEKSAPLRSMDEPSDLRIRLIFKPSSP